MNILAQVFPVLPAKHRGKKILSTLYKPLDRMEDTQGRANFDLSWIFQLLVENPENGEGRGWRGEEEW